MKTILPLDRDIATIDKDAIQKAHKIAKLFVQYNISVKMSYINNGDIGDLNLKEVNKIIKSAKPWNTSFALKSKIRNMKSGSIL